MSDQPNPSQNEPQIKVLPKKRIVRKLAVGQEVQGRVKRLTDFGAFIDIGVGTDALVHVSEMSQRRIKSPKDVLKVGQEVTAWIKALDKAHNRISLTLLPPGTRTIRDLEVGEVLTGTVTRITNYGAFVDIGVGYDGMVHVKEMAHDFVKHPSDVVQEGQEVQVEVIKINRRRGLIDLSMKNLLPEPEPEEPEEPEEVAEPDMAAEEEEEVLSPFELALLRAQEKRSKRKEKKRKKKAWYQETEEDEIIRRTLELAERD
ncbi:MAG TPA: S1 RNA-binding domain-containing protein [Anaerolineae bacterium]|nr:S1 RNA-binding domain-containing protein [Anaerolineae bacterium]